MKKTLFLAILFVVVGLAFPAVALKIDVLKTSNGLPFWFVQDKSVPVVSMAFSFDGGGASVPAGQEGLGTFAVSLLDEGSGDLSAQQIKEKLEDIGVSISFGVDADYTHGTFRTTTLHLKEAVELFHLMLTKPRFDRDAIERIRDQMVVAIRNYEKAPSFFNDVALSRLLFKGHPYGRRLGGTVATLEKITREDLVGYLKAVFTRDHLKVVVCGNLTPEQAKKMVDDIFKDLSEKSTYASIARKDLALKAEVIVTKKPFPQSNCIFVQQGLQPTDPKYVMLGLLGTILGDGFNSRLIQELREKTGLVYGVGVSTALWRSAEAFTGNFSSGNEGVAQAIDLVKKIWLNVQQKGVTAEELQRAKDTMLGSFIFSFTNTLSTAQTLLGYYRLGFRPDYVYAREKRINSVTLDQLNEFARAFLKPDELTFVVTGDPQGLKK